MLLKPGTPIKHTLNILTIQSNTNSGVGLCFNCSLNDKVAVEGCIARASLVIWSQRVCNNVSYSIFLRIHCYLLSESVLVVVCLFAGLN